MKRSIEEQQPPLHDLDKMRRKLARSISHIDHMRLDHIEYNPNYIGLFAHVIYYRQPMKFLISYNQLRRDGIALRDIADMLHSMAEKQWREKQDRNHIFRFTSVTVAD